MIKLIERRETNRGIEKMAPTHSEAIEYARRLLADVGTVFEINRSEDNEDVNAVDVYYDTEHGTFICTVWYDEYGLYGEF